MSRAQDIIDRLDETHPHRPRFRQAAEEVLRHVAPVVQARAELREHKILERLLEPERVFRFSVVWEDDDHQVQVHRAWRIQHCGALGPYKGGLRFHPSVDEDVLGFLAFEQVFKNALTGLDLGGAKGGSDFDPKGRSQGEIRRFCTAMMRELQRHIGQRTDVPAGDIGVGATEIGFLFGAYRRFGNPYEGALTGKKPSWGGSRLRREATGYGLVYLVDDLLDGGLEGQRVAVSGAGNVALHAAEKLLAMGATVVTLSDSAASLVFDDGLSADDLEQIRTHKAAGGSLDALADDLPGATAHPASERAHWRADVDVALPCATENELDDGDAQALVDSGIRAVAEGANMPCTPDALEVLREADVLFVPGKAANAGGVAVSGLEMVQNAGMEQWDRDVVDQRLRKIMSTIRCRIEDAAEEWGSPGNLAAGADIAGFLRVSQALIAQGL